MKRAIRGRGDTLVVHTLELAGERVILEGRGATVDEADAALTQLEARAKARPESLTLLPSVGDSLVEDIRRADEANAEARRVSSTGRFRNVRAAVLWFARQLESSGALGGAVPSPDRVDRASPDPHEDRATLITIRDTLRLCHQQMPVECELLVRSYGGGEKLRELAAMAKSAESTVSRQIARADLYLRGLLQFAEVVQTRRAA